MEELFQIAGEEFYFDLDKISDYVRIEEEKQKDLDKLLSKKVKEDESEIVNPDYKDEYIPQGPLIDMTRWDLTKAMIETILSENGIVDEDMGSSMLGKQLSIPFRLSFNTLIKHKLIKRNN